MNIIKYLFKYLFFLLLAVTVVACGRSTTPAVASNLTTKESNVIATNTIIANSPGEAGTSPQNPASGTQVITSDNFEYSVIEVLGGEQAWNLLKNASAFNKPPENASLEYMLVKVHIRSSESNNQTLSIDPAHIEGVIGSDGVLLDRPSMVDVRPPEPILQADLEPGEAAEGWVTVIAPKNDAHLILVIQPRINGLSLGGTDTRYISLR